jgi:muramoyltetrapeptide carboxypeptidase
MPKPRTVSPDRIHLIAHCNPLEPDLIRFGLADAEEYVEFIRRALPAALRLTYDLPLLKVTEHPWHGGRNDDEERIRDVRNALDDRRTLAIVAASGGGYLTRIIPHLRFDRLRRRTSPLWVLGFSEMSTLVNAVAAYPRGRGLYWLCPNFLGWRLSPPEVARAALVEFWRILPEVLAARVPTTTQHIPFGPLRGQLVSGKARSGKVRLVGGCLAVLAAIAGPLAKRIRPDGRWLILEDIKEAPYRIDRHLAAFKVAGWFEKIAGVLVGDFRMLHEDTQPAVLELLKYHLPARRNVPVVTTQSFGHTWPMMPVLLNQPLPMTVKAGTVVIGK